MHAVADLNTESRGSLRKKLLLLLPILVALFLYALSGHLAQHAAKVWIVKFPLDDQIPFVRWFIFPYFYWYLYSYGTIVLLMALQGAGRNYRRFVLSMTVTLVVAIVIFLTFPTHVPRPLVEGNDLAARMVRMIYGIDPPYSCLPSIHVAFSVLTFLELDILLRRGLSSSLLLRTALRAANATSALLICMATMFVKQHFSPDVISGIGIAVAARLLVMAMMRRSENRSGIEKTKTEAPR